MKKILLLLVFTILAAAGSHAQQSKKGTAAANPQFTLNALAQPAASPSLLLIGGRIEKGKKEQFGALIGASQAAVIEFLAADGKVIKSVTAADLLGKSGGVRLVRASGDEAGTHAELAYEIQFPQGKNELLIRSIAATGGRGTKAKVSLSFALKAPLENLDAVRITLPVEGQAAAQQGGFVVSSKTQAASFSAAVFPKPASSAVEKNAAVFIVHVLPVQGASEQPLAWMIAEGSSAPNAAAAKTEAAASLKANALYDADPNVVIVTTADKVSTQPNDTVTYSLVCTNIGLGDATDVVVSNPIPAGTSFVEGSAAGSGTDITVDREKSQAPQLGAARSVKWKLNGPLKPGAEKIVTFKILVR